MNQKPSCRQLTLASLMGLASLLLLSAAPTAAQIPGATYSGDHSGTRDAGSPSGPRVNLVVSDDGNRVTDLDILDLPYGSPAYSDWQAAIANHHFSAMSETLGYCIGSWVDPFDPPTCYSGSRWTLEGTFDNGQGVAGTIHNELLSSSGGSTAIASKDLTWSASTLSPVPPSLDEAPESSKRSSGAVIAGGLAPVRGGKAVLSLRCKSSVDCRGVVKLIARVKVGNDDAHSTRLRLAKRVRRLLIGRSTYKIPARESRTIRVGLNRRGRRLSHQAGERGLKAMLAGPALKNRVVRLKPSTRKRPAQRKTS